LMFVQPKYTYVGLILLVPEHDNGWRICGEQFTRLKESNRFKPTQPVVRARNMRLFYAVPMKVEQSCQEAPNLLPSSTSLLIHPDVAASTPLLIPWHVAEETLKSMRRFVYL